VGWLSAVIQEVYPGIVVIVAFAAFILYTRPAFGLLTRTVYRNAPLGRTRALIRVLRFSTFGIRRASFYHAACLWTEVGLLRPRPARPDRYECDSDEEYRAQYDEYRVQRKEWLRAARRQLGNLMAGAGDKPRKIVVPTCFDLFRNEDEIRRYFVVRSADSPASEDASVAFHSRVEVTEGFIAPLHLLAGLISHAGDEWKPVLDNYGAIMVRPADPLDYDVRALQTFLFTCWLLWGPSIPICTCDQWTGRSHLQFGYGDENNSIPLRIEVGDHPYTDPWPPAGGQHGGYPVLAVQASVTGRIMWAQDVGVRGFTPAQQPSGAGHKQLLLLADGVDRPGGTPAMVAQRYYSAYIWVIFLICDQQGRPLERDRWRNMLTFFEHGNIAEEYTFDALKRQLAHKARFSIERILRDEPTLTLRYACAIDESGCGSRIEYPPPAGRSIKDIVFDSGWAEGLDRDGVRRVHAEPPTDGSYSACHLPEVLAEYPKGSRPRASLDPADVDGGLTFTDLTAAPEDIRTLVDFYTTLYVDQFPDPDERESLDNMIHYLGLRERGWYGRNNYHILLAAHDGRLVGGSVVDYLAEPDVGMIEFLLVAPGARRSGLGRRLLAETERLLADDARRHGQRLGAVLAEMNDPLAPTAKDDSVDPTDRALIWHRWGYAGLDFPYRQPALSAEQEAVTNLIMIAKPIRADWRAALPAETVRLAVHEYLRLAMRIANPTDSPDYVEMAEYLAGLPAVPTIDLARYVGRGPATLRITAVSGPGDPDFAVASARCGLPVPAEEFAAGRHHLWWVRGESTEGAAVVYRLGGGGFVGRVTLTGDLHALSLVLARMEDRILHDRPGTAGWYLWLSRTADSGPFGELGWQQVADGQVRLLFKPYGRRYRAAGPTEEAVRAVLDELADAGLAPRPGRTEAAH
jgi:GNAT superfamily N-acetyltransferase